MLKIIDMHAHIGTTRHWTPWVSEFFRVNSPRYYEEFGKEISPSRVISFFKGQGVDRVVMLSEYAPRTSGVVPNEFTEAFCRDHEELIPFGAICLYSDVPLAEQARHAVEDLGMRGFKLLPSYQHFYPNDPILFPFYDYVQEKGLPIMFHTGISIFAGSRVKYAVPVLLDDVADEFPRLTLIMEHGGRPFWYDVAQWLIGRHRNLHIGIAGTVMRKLPQTFPDLERYQDRFIFGSDWPGMPDVKGLIERILRLPISDEAKEKILHENAERVMGLSRTN